MGWVGHTALAGRTSVLTVYHRSKQAWRRALQSIRKTGHRYRSAPEESAVEARLPNWQRGAAFGMRALHQPGCVHASRQGNIGQCSAYLEHPLATARVLRFFDFERLAALW